MTRPQIIHISRSFPNTWQKWQDFQRNFSINRENSPWVKNVNDLVKIVIWNSCIYSLSFVFISFLNCLVPASSCLSSLAVTPIPGTFAPADQTLQLPGTDSAPAELQVRCGRAFLLSMSTKSVLRSGHVCRSDLPKSKLIKWEKGLLEKNSLLSETGDNRRDTVKVSLSLHWKKGCQLRFKQLFFLCEKLGEMNPTSSAQIRSHRYFFPTSCTGGKIWQAWITHLTPKFKHYISSNA